MNQHDVELRLHLEIHEIFAHGTNLQGRIFCEPAAHCQWRVANIENGNMSAKMSTHTSDEGEEAGICRARNQHIERPAGKQAIQLRVENRLTVFNSGRRPRKTYVG